ncbi:MAG: hypothetical protein AB7S41_10425 [Parvibaculaceae bacterium]
MTEQEFADLVDCKFPYRDEAAWKQAIDMAAAISVNASFIALSEICQVPKGTRLSIRSGKQMLAYWQESLDHPLKKIVLPFAVASIERRILRAEEAVEGMRAIAEYPGQLAALSIPYMSCSDDEGKADSLYNSILARWNAAS